MRPQQTAHDRRDDALPATHHAAVPTPNQTTRRWFALAAGVGLSLAVVLILSSCEGSPTSSALGTTGSGGGGGGGTPPGYTRVNMAEPLQGTVSGSDTVCAGPNYSYVGGPCQKFAIAVSGKAGTLTVQLAWDQPDTLLALSATAFDGWAECCQSPLTHQVPVSAGASWVFVQVTLVGPGEPTGGPAATTSQKFILSTSFSPQ